MNEAETRAEHIDPALTAAGWGVVDGSRIEGQGRRGKSLTADYVLIYRNNLLAVIEAKAWDVALTEGVAQAKDYAGKLAVRYPMRRTGRASTVLICSRGPRVAPDTRKKLLAGLTDSPLLRLKYHDSIADAVADLGDAERIGMLFTGFQRYLYQEASPT